MRMKLLTAAAAGALALSMAGAANATITYTLGTGNAAIAGFPAPYGSVDVTLTDPTHANISFTAANTGGNQYYFTGAQAADVNVNAISWTITGLTENGAGTLSSGGSGNVDGWGVFNQTTNLTDGYTDRASAISFTLTNTGGIWTGDSNVLIANASGNTVAAHIGACNTGCTAFVNNGTGFATNGPPGVIPEPGTWAMMIIGFGGIGALLRRRRAPQLATV